MSPGACAALWLCVIILAGCGGSQATQPHRGTAHRRNSTASPLTATRPMPQAQPPRPPAATTHRVLLGRIPDRLPTSGHVVALTFDARADDAGAPKILGTLAETGAPATFFMTERWAELYPRWAARIAARYAIGNRTFDHQDLLTLTLPDAGSELLKASAAIKHATGRPPVPLFRFPYGSSNASTLALVNRLGYTAVGWTVDTLG